MNEAVSSDSELRQEYLDAIFVTELPHKGLPARFGVVTACNPEGRLNSADRNVEADAQLKLHLEQAALEHFRVTGRSLDGSHQEPGFGIITEDFETIRLLSREFQQQAFFWIQEGILFCASVGDSKLHRIGLWSERQIPS